MPPKAGQVDNLPLHYIHLISGPNRLLRHQTYSLSTSGKGSVGSSLLGSHVSCGGLDPDPAKTLEQI